MRAKLHMTGKQSNQHLWKLSCAKMTLLLSDTQWLASSSDASSAYSFQFVSHRTWYTIDIGGGIKILFNVLVVVQGGMMVVVLMVTASLTTAAREGYKHNSNNISN